MYFAFIAFFDPWSPLYQSLGAGVVLKTLFAHLQSMHTVLWDYWKQSHHAISKTPQSILSCKPFIVMPNKQHILILIYLWSASISQPMNRSGFSSQLTKFTPIIDTSVHIQEANYRKRFSLCTLSNFIGAAGNHSLLIGSAGDSNLKKDTSVASVWPPLKGALPGGGALFIFLNDFWWWHACTQETTHLKCSPSWAADKY